MKISVALAAYNGEQYIRDQILSILPQLCADDEIVVSDDNPSGSTKSAIDDLLLSDNRIIYIVGPGKGVVANFENALNHCSGDIIFLSDQDDVWVDNKVEKVVAEIQRGSSLVIHDAKIVDKNLNTLCESCFFDKKTNLNFYSNLLKNTFVGCCMAFNKDVMPLFTPFPKNIPMHDWYIALKLINSGNKVAMINEPLILWRRHDANVTGKKTSILQKILWRFELIKSIYK